jgi:putative flippase GtrA
MNNVGKYIIFSIFSTLINLFFQYISFVIYKGFLDIYFAMFFGTLAGLIFKYIVDKKFIFYHKVKNKKDDGKKFILYTLTGVFTTFIFFGFEISFYHIFEDKNAKYIGAIIGLSIGYIIKYFLDKKFVFVRKD